MISKSQIAHLCLSAFLLPLVAATSAYAGSSVIGLVKGSTNASVGGQRFCRTRRFLAETASR